MRKKLIASEWMQDLLIAVSLIVLLAAVGWVIWFMYELIWVFRCAFGGC